MKLRGEFRYHWEDEDAYLSLTVWRGSRRVGTMPRLSVEEVESLMDEVRELAQKMQELTTPLATDTLAQEESA